MDTKGNIEINNEIANCETFFELLIDDKDKTSATLSPQSGQDTYLIEHQESLLKHIFEIQGKGATNIQCGYPVQYKLYGDVWFMKEKGKINLI